MPLATTTTKGTISDKVNILADNITAEAKHKGNVLSAEPQYSVLYSTQFGEHLNRRGSIQRECKRDNINMKSVERNILTHKHSAIRRIRRSLKANEENGVVIEIDDTYCVSTQCVRCK